MANNLDKIVTVNIDIANPAIDSTNFDSLLIIGPAPKIQSPIPTVGVYSSLSEVTSAGYETIGEHADPIGVAARIAFSQNPRPTKIFIAVIENTKTPVETLEIANKTAGWYVACAAGIDENELQSCAEWTEAHTKLFAYTFLSDKDPVDKIFFRSHGWCGLVKDNQDPKDIPQSNNYLHVAATARGLSFPAGSETWAYQSVAGVIPSELSSTLLKELEDGHSNWIESKAGRTITMNGQTRSGEWIDIVRGRDWLQNDMQLRIFNLLLMRSKIPFTNAGIALVENAMIASLKAAQERGIVAPDEYDEDENYIPGFIVNMPNIMSLSSTEKASRNLKGCTFTARIAGAIHAVTVNGVLTYEIFSE